MDYKKPPEIQYHIALQILGETMVKCDVNFQSFFWDVPPNMPRDGF